MPVKIFSANATDTAALETKVNEWMGKLEPGAVRNVTTAGGQGSQQIVVTVWYTETKDRN